MRLATFTIALLALSARAGNAQLCSQPPDSSNRFAMREDHFTRDAAPNRLSHLRDRIPALLKSATSVDALRQNAVYYIGYYNSVMFLEGYVLKLEAQLAQSELRAARLALQGGQGSESTIAERQQRFAAAQAAFCEFLTSHTWVD